MMRLTGGVLIALSLTLGFVAQAADKKIAALFLDKADLPPGLKAGEDRRGGTEEHLDAMFKKHKASYVGFRVWNQPDGSESPISRLVDIRFVFPAADNARAFLEEYWRILADDAPPAKDAEKVGEDCRAFCGVTPMFQMAGLDSVTAVYLFRRENVVIKLFAVLSATGGKSGIKVLTPVARKAHARAQGADPGSEAPQEKPEPGETIGNEDEWDQVVPVRKKPTSPLPVEAPSAPPVVAPSAPPGKDPSAPPAGAPAKPAAKPEAQPKAKGPVPDVLLSIGMSMNMRSGLHPRHESDAFKSSEAFRENMGFRFDGRLFFRAAAEQYPILGDFGIGASINFLPGLEYAIQGDEVGWETTQYIWQLGLMYRLPLLEVMFKPSFVFRVGYGSTICTIDTDSAIAVSAEYGYPYLAVDFYLALWDPYVSLWASIGYKVLSSSLVHGGGEENMVEDDGNGLVYGFGLDIALMDSLHLGLGYEDHRFLGMIMTQDNLEISDTFKELFLRIGWLYR